MKPTLGGLHDINILHGGKIVMTITFNIDKSQRKSLAHRIGELMGAEVRYCGVPSCAYQIGSMMLGKNAVLIGEADKNALRTLLNALNDEGYQFFTDSPQNAQESVCEGDIDTLVQAEQVGYTSEDGTDEDGTVATDVSIASADENTGEDAADDTSHLTISMPRSFFTDQALDNLRRIVSNKSTLIKHALNTDSLDIVVTDDKIEFPWFTLIEDGDSAAYMQFIPMLCEFAKVRKRVVAKTASSDSTSDDSINEKYAFRCFLLRLGMIGEEYKAARKVLLRNLTGSSAFRSGKPESSENHNLNQSEGGAQNENTVSE